MMNIPEHIDVIPLSGGASGEMAFAGFSGSYKTRHWSPLRAFVRVLPVRNLYFLPSSAVNSTVH